MRERQSELDLYVLRRSILDDFDEPARPSVDDVESVLGVVAAAVEGGGNQRTFEAASSGDAFHAVHFTDSDGRKASMFAPGYGQGLAEGRTWYLRLSAGRMGLRCADANKKERADQREKDRQRKAADAVAVSIACEDCVILKLRRVGGSRGEIAEWSARSRARMSELVCSLDFSEWTKEDGTLAMVTLTLPYDWYAVAPDGKTFKKQLKRFELRWRRNVGPWRLLWKLEFQGRGAPHWHALMRVPALVEVSGKKLKFEEWLSQTWADCVGASTELDRCKLKDRSLSSEYSRHVAGGTRVDFSGKDFSDPRRISLYFLGHSAKTTDGKEYQHRVPAEWQEPGKGPGRFWGNPGLVNATREIEVTERDAVQVARVLRKVKRGRAWTTAVIRERGKLPEGQRVQHRTFGVELRQKAGQKRGRAARKTFNRKMQEAAAARGETYIRKAAFRASSLGAGGYAVGGWVMVNDALQLGLDVARYFTPVAAEPSHWIGLGTPGQRRETVTLARQLRKSRDAASAPLVPLSTRMEA